MNGTWLPNAPVSPEGARRAGARLILVATGHAYSPSTHTRVAYMAPHPIQVYTI